MDSLDAPIDDEYDEYDGDDGVDENEEWDQGAGLVADAALQLLETHGAQTVKDLAELLAARQPELFGDGDLELEPGELPHYLADIMEAFEGFWTIPDGRVVAYHALVRNSRFTHRLTESELRRGVIDMHPDFPLLDYLAVLSLPMGEAIGHVSEADDERADVRGSLIGPSGWLASFAAGDLVTLQGPEEALEVVRVDEASAEENVERVIGYAREMFGTASRAPEMFEFVANLGGTYPDAFKEPTIPLTQLLERSGIELRDDWLGLAGTEWSTPTERVRDRHLNEALQASGLDPCCQREARHVYHEWVAWDGLTTLEHSAAHHLVDSLGHGPAAELLWEVATFNGDRGQIDKVGAWATMVAAEMGSEAAAPVEFLLAATADRGGDGLAAEAHLLRALDDDPTHHGSLLMLSELAEDRGDARRSAELQLKAGRSAGSLRIAPILAVRPRQGRNEACACGSGRKYKACCARNPAALPAQIRARWLLDRAARFAVTTMPQQFSTLEFSATRVFGDGDDLSEVFCVDLLLFESGGLKRYLASRGPLLAEEELTLASSWLSSPWRLLEVTATKPGESFEATDLRSGDPFLVLDGLASADLSAGRSILARLVRLPEFALIAGGVVDVHPRARPAALDMLDRGVKPKQVFDLIEALSAPPRLRTREGQPLELLRCTYQVGDSAQVRAALLDTFEELESEGPEANSVLVQIHQLNDLERILRGRIEFDERTVVLDTNARARLDALEEMLLSVAPEAELIDEESTSAADLMRQVALRQGALRQGDAPSPEEELDPELVAFAAQHMQQLEKRWVDESIPALGGLTPRQALQDPTRRTDLLAILADMDRRRGGNGFDAGRLRLLLGLQD